MVKTGQKQKKGGLYNNYIGKDPYNSLHQPIEKENPLEVPYTPPSKDLDILDGDLNTLEEDEAFKKLSIALIFCI